MTHNLLLLYCYDVKLKMWLVGFFTFVHKVHNVCSSHFQHACTLTVKSNCVIALIGTKAQREKLIVNMSVIAVLSI